MRFMIHVDNIVMTFNLCVCLWFSIQTLLSAAVQPPLSSFTISQST